jgi:8-oxo-dGTP pyrophosphatase MutT (NUDIX family)
MVWTPRATVAAVIERGGAFLMVEEAPGGSPVLNQPAGHLETGESLLDAVVREVGEETGLRFVPAAIVGIYRWRNPASGETYLRTTFAGQVEGEAPARPPDPEIRRSLWLERKSILEQGHRLRSPLVMLSIDDYLAGRRFDLTILRDVE